MKAKNLLKKAFLLLALMGGATSAWASTVEDLKTIATDYVFIADNFTNVGTTQLTNNTLYDGGLVLACGSGGTKTVSNGKGTSTIEGTVYNNSLRVKTTQDNYAFKVSGPCTLTIYKQAWNGRYFYVGTSNSDKSYYEETSGSATTLECNITAAGVVYIWSSTDVYFAGFKIEYPKTGQPTISANPASAEYSQGDVATALSVSATAASEGALSYQWYKNETNQSVLAGEGATAIDGATNATYTPSTAAAGTTYYFCKVTEEGNANVATSRMAKIVVNPAGFDVTYSLGEVTGTVGTLPANESAVTSVTIPVNKTLYKDGNTLTAWNDGTADHAIGSTFDVASDITLTPVFSPNGENAHLGYNATTVTWDFQTKNGAPTWQLEGNTGVQITQTTVGGSSIDVKLDIDATSGKLNNASWTDWAQFNEGTKLIVPVLTGAMVKLYTMNEGSGTTFGGNPADSYASNIHSYTATSDGNLEVVAGSGVGYVRYISVTYPSETAVLAVSAANETAGLTKAIINSVDYLAVATENWSSQTIGDYTGEFYNLSNSSRNLTIKVTGASRFEVYVKNSTANRTYKVKVGSGDAQTVTHGGTGVESSGVFTIADPAAETTITISGDGGSVYPGYFVFDPAVSITPANDKSTYVTTKILDFSNVEGGLKAYIATNAAAGVVTMQPVGAVPAGTPLMLVGTADKEYKVPVAAEASALGTNMFEAGDGTTVFDGTTFDYILFTDGLFYKIGSGTVATNKAYLHCDSDPTAGGARELRISFGDNITGIEQIDNGQLTIDNSQDGKFIENGKLVIVKNGVKYNAAGAKLY